MECAGRWRIAVSPTGGVTSCSASAGNITCSFNVQYAHESNGSPGYVDGKATLKCSGVVDYADVEVKLQKEVNGSWQDVPGSTGTRHIQPVKANTGYVTMSGGSIRCVPGTYRTAARGSGSLAGVGSRSFDWQYSGANNIRC